VDEDVALQRRQLQLIRAREVLYQGVLPRDDLVRDSADADLGRVDDEQRWDAAAVDLHLIHRVLVSHWARRPG
jgi:hypothetical protein